MDSCFILKGNIAYSESLDKIQTFEDGFLICIDGKVAGVYPDEDQIPRQYRAFELLDYSEYLIIPGMTDLHIHAPQYTNRGIGLDLELLDWLDKYTFPEEVMYKDIDYAEKAYDYFTEDLRRCFTSRAVVFATVHNESTKLLMDRLEKSGVVTYVGRVNQDRLGSELEEESAKASLDGTCRWLDETIGKYERTFPILTPRFIPSCTDELMKGIGRLAEKRHLRIQSHLSENPSEVELVKELVPQSTCYGNAYEITGTMGEPDRPAIMAHCVYSSDEEMEILKKHGAFVAHSPESNLNITSGIAPVRKMLDRDLNVGIATDVAGGSSMNMLDAMKCALQSSKAFYRLVDQSDAPLTFDEVFYLATAGGGRYFGKVGTFKPGYDFDAVIIDDAKMLTTRRISVKDRVERLVYNSADSIIRDKYVRGVRVFMNQD